MPRILYNLGWAGDPLYDPVYEPRPPQAPTWTPDPVYEHSFRSSNPHPRQGPGAGHADHTTRVNWGKTPGLAKLVLMNLVPSDELFARYPLIPSAPLRRSAPALRSSSPHSRSAAPFPAPAPILCSAPLIRSSLSRLPLRFSDPRPRSAPPFLHFCSALRFSDSRSAPLIPTPFRSSGPHLAPQLAPRIWTQSHSGPYGTFTPAQPSCSDPLR